MAHRIRLPCALAQIPDPQPVATDKEGKLTTQSVGVLNAFMKSVTTAINGGISIGDGRQSSQSGNIDGQTITVLTPAAPNTQFSVPHGLDRIPIGRLILGQDLPGHLYDTNKGGWGREVFFKCDAASVTFTLVLV